MPAAAFDRTFNRAGGGGGGSMVCVYITDKNSDWKNIDSDYSYV